ncbi:MAG: DUF4157 domain-containing protein [Chloroflexi bacterium]|nr:DUF4157 domain-containing protein [Chloroflexota bacterium]
MREFGSGHRTPTTTRRPRPASLDAAASTGTRPSPREPLSAQGLIGLQRTVGNAALDDLLGGSGAPVAAVEAARNSDGSALDEAVRTPLEGAFGTDFSSVRLHRGAAADASARTVGAVAYTVGEDIVLGAAAADTSSPAGRGLLAHELTHVVQQRTGPVAGFDAGGLRISDPGDPFEQQASATAAHIVAGDRGIAGATRAGSVSEPVLARETELEAETADSTDTESIAPEVQSGLEILGSTTEELADGGSGDGGWSGDGGDSSQVLATGSGTSSTTFGPPTSSTYTVSGTLLEAANAMAARTEAGKTASIPSRDTDTIDDTVTAARVVVTEDVELPSWADRGGANAAQQAEWDRFSAALSTHEDGHVAIDRRAWAAAHTKLVGKSKTAADTAYTAISTSADQANDAYDVANGRGLKQGTNINPNLGTITKVP